MSFAVEDAPPADRSRTDRVDPGAGRRSDETGSGLGALAACATLVVLTVPSIATVSLPVRFGPLEGDFNVHQATIVTASLTMLGLGRGLGLTRFTQTLVLICWATALYNLTTCLWGSRYLLNPLFRGIVNCTLNTLAALAIAQCLERRAWRAAALRGVCAFGVIVAASAIVEFAFLKTSGGLLSAWRSLVWGPVPADRLLTAGGVTLDPGGLSRVGGLVGAPENLGYVLAMTLPFVLVFGVSTTRMAGIGLLYALAAAVSGSRTLAVSLSICAVLVLLGRRAVTARARIGIVAALLSGMAAVVAFDINSEVASRFTTDAIRYEIDWRLGRALDLLDEQRRSGSWATGLGFGLGAEQVRGLPPVTSGVLGGDGIVAFALGGVGGAIFLLVLWSAIVRTRTTRTLPHRARLALDAYAAVVACSSLLTPVLTQIVLTANVFTVLMIAFPIMAERAGT